MRSFPEIETEYQNAKTRLLNAQQEKLEAAAEFLEARAALHQTLEMIWPDRCECGTEFGYDIGGYEQHKTREYSPSVLC